MIQNYTRFGGGAGNGGYSPMMAGLQRFSPQATAMIPSLQYAQQPEAKKGVSPDAFKNIASLLGDKTKEDEVKIDPANIAPGKADESLAWLKDNKEMTGGLLGFLPSLSGDQSTGFSSILSSLFGGQAGGQAGGLF